ncbi:hypothetical protein WKI71_26110 [Streptomyces sp. MS1.AVA.1]|uniref:Uncharacterized protein n=1 Tax=Streptomyces machairae TaxID=3134109 RepID=A0ABU8UP22_9ACTN
MTRVVGAGTSGGEGGYHRGGDPTGGSHRDSGDDQALTALRERRVHAHDSVFSPYCG